jgi:hypothetical protein
MKSLTDGANSNACDCQTAKSVDTLTDGITNKSGKSNARVLWHLFTDGCADGLWKIWRDFQNFSAKFKKYRWNLMSLSKKILFYVPSVTLKYKTQPPLCGSFFLWSSSFILFSPPANPLCFSLYFYCFDCSFQHIKRYDSPFFIFVFFLLFFYFNYDYFCGVLCFVYCL